MRTTLVLDDALVNEAKHRAVELRLSLSEFVNRALRDALRPPSVERAGHFHVVTYGSTRRQRHEPQDFHEATERDDRDSLSKR